MTTLTEQLNLVANQIKDIEAAKRATEKSMHLTKKEAVALADARESMKALSTYSLLKPSMDTAEANLSDKLAKLKEFETVAENAIDKFYDMLAEFSDIHAGMLTKVNELEIIPNSHATEVEALPPKTEHVVPTKPIAEQEPYIEPKVDVTDAAIVDTFDPFEDTPDPEVSKTLDEIAPKPVKGRSDLDDLALSLKLNPESVEDAPLHKPKVGTEALSNFDELDAKLFGAHFK